MDPTTVHQVDIDLQFSRVAWGRSSRATGIPIWGRLLASGRHRGRPGPAGPVRAASFRGLAVSSTRSRTTQGVQPPGRPRHPSSRAGSGVSCGWLAEDIRVIMEESGKRKRIREEMPSGSCCSLTRAQVPVLLGCLGNPTTPNRPEALRGFVTG